MRLQNMLAQLPPLQGSVDAGIDSPGHAAHEQIILHLDERGFVPFHPVLAETFGHKAAIFVGLALYWTRHSLRKHPQRGGWFNMSMQQWQQAIGLTRSEQATVRETLMLAGILEEMLIGQPAVMNYRVNVVALTHALADKTSGLANPTWEAVGSWLRSCKVYYKPLADVAGNIAAGLYLSYLLQCHRDRLRLGQLDNGCISVSQADIAFALTLGTKVQRNARDRLKKAGLIQERGAGGNLVRINFEAVLMCLRGQAIKPLKGRGRKQAPLQQQPLGPEAAAGLQVSFVQPMPPTTASKTTQKVGAVMDLSGLGIAFGQLTLNLTRPAPIQAPQRSRDLLMAFLAEEPPVAQLVGNRQVEVSEVDSQRLDSVARKSNTNNGLGCDAKVSSQPVDHPPQNAVSCNLEIAETCKQDLPFPAIYIQRGISINTTTTAKTCKEVTSNSSGGVDSSSNAEEESKYEPAVAQTAALIYPAKLSDSQRLAVASVVNRAPMSDRQELLDELHGKLESGKEVRSPAGWLSGLISKRRSGEVIVFTYAAQVATDRERESGKPPSMLGESHFESTRCTEMREMSAMLSFLKSDHVYVIRRTGTLVKLDTTINEVRIKRTDWPDWRVTRDAGPLIRAMQAGELDEHKGGHQ